MTHRYHPDPDRDDPPEAILWDDCEDCAQRAEHLNTLDAGKLRRLVAVQEDDWDHIPTANERVAASRMWEALLVMERLTHTPWQELVGVRRVLP